MCAAAEPRRSRKKKKKDMEGGSSAGMINLGGLNMHFYGLSLRPIKLIVPATPLDWGLSPCFTKSSVCVCVCVCVRARVCVCVCDKHRCGVSCCFCISFPIQSCFDSTSGLDTGFLVDLCCTFSLSIV